MAIFSTSASTSSRTGVVVGAVLLVLAALWYVNRDRPPAGVLMYRNGLTGEGVNSAETTLTPDSVGGETTFGRQFITPVDGQVYAQPLFVPELNVTVGPAPGIHDTVFVATEHDSLYAINAIGGNVLWQRSFIDPDRGVTTMPWGETSTDDISVEVGITATPAIDLASNTILVVAKFKETGSGQSHYVHRLIGVDMSTGEISRQVVIADTTHDGGQAYTYNTGPYVVGSGDGHVTIDGENRVYFNAMRQAFRSGLVLHDGNVYLASASHGDYGPFHGWVLSYSVADLTLNGALNTTPNGGQGGIWQGSGITPFDADGFLYFVTGNGTFNEDPTNFDAEGFPIDGNYGDSFVKVARDPTTTETSQHVNGWGLKVVDYFTPFNEQAMADSDSDLGAGGPTILPDAVGSAAHPRLLVGGGKEGRIYLIDRDDMGKHDPATNHVVQEVAGAVAGIMSTPAYLDGTLYYTPAFGGPIAAFSVANGTISSTPIGQTPDDFLNRAGSPFISSSGDASAILWNLERETGQLRAYDAADLSSRLYPREQGPDDGDQAGTVLKFTVPTVVGGRVYVGTSNALVAYGLPRVPTGVPAAPANLTAAARLPGRIDLRWIDTANDEESFVVERSRDGASDWQQLGATEMNVTTFTDATGEPFSEYFYRVLARNPLGDSAPGNVVSATRTDAPPIGSGDGLLGRYYDSEDFSNLRVTRVDPTIDFDWGTGSPDPAIAVDTFSVRWTGQIQADADGDYTFYTATDDGVRLILDGVTIIDRFMPQSGTEHASSPVALEANRHYPVVMEYYEGRVDAVATLSWSRASTPKAIVPQGQLFSGVAPTPPSDPTATPSSGTEVDLAWTDTSTRETGFAIERRDGSGGLYRQVALVGPDTETYRDTALIPDKTYVYRVRATNFGGDSTPSNETSVTPRRIDPGS